MSEDLTLTRDDASRRRDISELEALETELANRTTQARISRWVTWIGVPAVTALLGLEITDYIASDIGGSLLAGVLAVPVMGWWLNRKRPLETIRSERAELEARLNEGSSVETAGALPRASAPSGSLDPRIEQALRELEIEVAAAELRLKATKTASIPLKLMSGVLLLMATIFLVAGILSPGLSLFGAVVPLPLLAGALWGLARLTRQRDEKKAAELAERREVLEAKQAEFPEFSPLSPSARAAMGAEYNQQRYRSMLDHSWLNRIGFSVILGGGLLAMVSNSLLVLPVILFGIVLMGVGFLGWERSTGEFPPIDRTLLSDDTAGTAADE